MKNGRHIEGGREYWYLDDVLHRSDGPAVIYPDGFQSWWVNGQPHRLDGPARIYADGRQEWWVEGKLHRLDGPAVIFPNGECEWWVDDERITIHHLRKLKMRGFPKGVGFTDDQIAFLRLMR